ncbi:MAG: GWxTD domain-containing protein [Gemmatimonadales bacterium]|nr:GWxTD domain-containing protein [Gemmatimonadales bacterium]
MAVVDLRPTCPSRSFFRFFFLLTVLGVGLVPGFAGGSLVHQLEGSGQFHSHVEVINRWRTEERLDVLVLVEVSNVDLGFQKEERGLVSRLNLEVEIVGPDGRVVQEKNQIRTVALSSTEAGSQTLSQVFGLVLEDVPFRSGRLVCRLLDLTRRRKGVYNQYRRKNYSSQSVCDWSAEQSPRHASGLAIEDPLFLVHAPMKTWNPDNVAKESVRSDWLQDYVHPSRRYGVEQESLQLAFPVWPPAGGIPFDEELPGLLVHAFSPDMTYSFNDTIEFDRRGRSALVAGRPAWVFYEMDLNQLPDGLYHLALAPLGGQGRGVVAGFEVTWRLAGMGRHRDLVQGEGYTIFSGSDLELFLEIGLSEQEKMLEEFWFEHDPDPENPGNTAYLEFQSRLSYVRGFLGGFGPHGAVDDRGLVHLLLGPADEVQIEPMPMNFQAQDDARVKVFHKFAPDRESSSDKGRAGSLGGAPHESKDGIPMPYSRLAEAQRQSILFSASHNFGFVLWKYDAGGRSLFPNRFSRTNLGARFLFIDRTGFGQYSLESSNLLQGEE